MEFFLDELAEVEPAKVAPELLSINSDDDDDSDDLDYDDKDGFDMNKTKIFSFT